MSLKKEFKLSMLFKIADIAKSTYYYWVKKLNEPDKYETIKEEIKAIVKQSKGRYGYRRVTIVLKQKGILINHKTVRKLMCEMNLTCNLRIKKYRSYRGKLGHIANNEIKREFASDKPNKKWVTDVTEFNLLGTKMYLSPILDLFNGEIISYTLFDRPTHKMVDTMLDKAFARKRVNERLILHSDQGWHYQMKEYQTKLKENNVVQSMSRKGNCLDNAVVENFFGIMKSEFFYNKKFTSLTEFKKEVHEYMYWYNHHRIKEKLNGLSPIQYRKQSI